MLYLHILINDYDGRLKATVPVVPQYSFISDSLEMIQKTVIQHMEEYFKKCAEELGRPCPIRENDVNLTMKVNAAKPVALMTIVLDDLQEGVDFTLLGKSDG